MGTPQFAPFVQTPCAAPAWIPYLNLQQGLRMDYPNTWTAQEQSSPLCFALFFGSPQEGPHDAFQENITITVQPVFPGTTLGALVQSWQAIATQAGLRILEAGPASLAQQQAHRALVQTPPRPPAGQANRVLLHLFLLNTKAYTVAYTGQSGDFDRLLPVAQQMLATLQVH